MNGIQIIAADENDNFWNDIYFSLKEMGYIKEEGSEDPQPAPMATTPKKSKWNWGVIFITTIIFLTLLLALNKYISNE
jgi:hypothetical protein